MILSNEHAFCAGALVSKGMFGGLCVRFTDDFQVNLDDWKPPGAGIMNLCVVSEGTYEVCSQTLLEDAPGIFVFCSLRTDASTTDRAKWVLNVGWKMEGVDIHLDTEIGRHLSSLARTLTALTEVVDEVPAKAESQESLVPEEMEKTPKDLETEMNDQVNC